MDSSTPVTLAMVLFALVAVALGYLVDRVSRRSLVNPWILGIAALVLAGGANAWFLVRAGILDVDDAFRQGELFGELVGGPVTLPLLLLVWQARRYSRRDAGPDGAKGSFKFALGVTLAFVLLTAVLSAIVGGIAGRGAGARAAERRSAAARGRAEALAKVAAELSASLPKTVDDETVLFRVTADGDTLAHHYRLVGLAKADVDPEKVAAFEADILKSSCGKQSTQDQFLRKGYVLQHMYYDKHSELITTVEVTAAACAGLAR